MFVVTEKHGFLTNQSAHRVLCILQSSVLYIVLFMLYLPSDFTVA